LAAEAGKKRKRPVERKARILFPLTPLNGSASIRVPAAGRRRFLEN
jgi:hypothetical protein